MKEDFVEFIISDKQQTIMGAKQGNPSDGHSMEACFLKRTTYSGRSRKMIELTEIVKQ